MANKESILAWLDLIAPYCGAIVDWSVCPDRPGHWHSCVARPDHEHGHVEHHACSCGHAWMVGR